MLARYFFSWGWNCEVWNFSKADGFYHTLRHRFKLAVGNQFVHVGLELIVHLLGHTVILRSVVVDGKGDLAQETPIVKVREQVIRRSLSPS